MLGAPFGKTLSQETCICVLFVDVNKECEYRTKITIRLRLNAALSIYLCFCLGAVQGPRFRMCCYKPHRRRELKMIEKMFRGDFCKQERK